MERFNAGIKINDSEIIITHYNETHKFMFLSKIMKEAWFRNVCNSSLTNDENIISQNGNFHDWIEEIANIRIYKDSCSVKLCNDNFYLYCYFPNEKIANDYITKRAKLYQEISVY